jgi:hypothetical protein
MATPYSDIYNQFLEQITDTDLLALTQSNRESLLFGLLKRACNRFLRICKYDLSDKNDTLKTFNFDLPDEESSIIVHGMIAEWYKPKYNFNENLKNVLNTKDYNQYSPANLLKETRESYKNANREFESMMNKYSYVHGSIEDLTTS